MKLSQNIYQRTYKTVYLPNNQAFLPPEVNGKDKAVETILSTIAAQFPKIENEQLKQYLFLTHISSFWSMKEGKSALRPTRIVGIELFDRIVSHSDKLVKVSFCVRSKVRITALHPDRACCIESLLSLLAS